VKEIVLRHAEISEEEAISTNASGGGKYIAVTITIHASSKAQLDSIYQDLTHCDQVLVAL
jgi:hypothetical protein